MSAVDPVATDRDILVSDDATLEEETNKAKRIKMDGVLEKNTNEVSVVDALQQTKPIDAEIKLSPEQQEVLQYIRRGANVFFTGAGGCGKSFLLQTLRKEYDNQQGVYTTATTGIAATNIGGTTLHSFAGIGLGQGTLQDVIENVSRFYKNVSRWRTARMLIIDEVSMLSADLFELIEAVARHFRQNQSFFGGLQMVFVGDFCQLPPVSKDANKKNRMLFESPVWKQADIKQFQLKTVFRQKESDMIHALSDIRVGNVSERAQLFLQSVCRPLTFEDGIEPTKLYARNSNVDAENTQRLALLEGESKTYIVRSTGSDKDKADLERNCMAANTINLKVGAQVMYLVNAFEMNLFNGSRGVVTGFCALTGFPFVRFMGHTEPVLVQLFRWEKKLGREILAERFQLPLKLAWAITIHKSQGMSIDRLVISLKDCFECGQAYVALSRATCSSGLSLSSFDASAITANPAVIAYYQHFKQK